MGDGPETRLVRRMVAKIKQKYPSAWVLKTHGNGSQLVGIPDLLICVHGLFIGLEVKAPRPGESDEAIRGRVTMLQQDRLDDINQAGGHAAAVWTIEQALDEIAKGLHTLP